MDVKLETPVQEEDFTPTNEVCAPKFTVNAKFCFSHGSVTLSTNSGFGFTLTSTSSKFLQPFTSVPITLYTFVSCGKNGFLSSIPLSH